MAKLTPCDQCIQLDSDIYRCTNDTRVHNAPHIGDRIIAGHGDSYAWASVEQPLFDSDEYIRKYYILFIAAKQLIQYSNEKFKSFSLHMLVLS